MKKVITIIAVVLVSISGFAQNFNPKVINTNVIDSLNNVTVHSKIALKYSGRENKSDTIYVSMTNWNYSSDKKVAVATLKEYIKKDSKFTEIGTSRVNFSKNEINAAFTAMNKTVIPAEKFTGFFEDFLTKSLIKQVKLIIGNGGNTLYGGVPSNWEVKK